MNFHSCAMVHPPAPARRSPARSAAPHAGRSKRDAVVRAALDLFAERSFDGTPVPLVAERAGVGAGTVYRYFASKQVLGNVVYRECKAALRGALVDAVPPGLPPRERFGHMWRGLARFAAEHPAAFRFLELQHHDDYLDDASRAASAELAERVADFVRSAQAAGAVRAGPAEVLIALALGAFVGLAREAAQDRLALDAGTVVRSEEAVWALLARA